MIPQYIYHIDPFIILLMMLFILITFLHDNVYVSRDPKKWTYLNEWMSELMQVQLWEQNTDCTKKSFLKNSSAWSKVI